MHNLIEYNANYSKTSGSLWQCYRDKTYDIATVNSESLKPKIRITGKTPADGNTKDVEIAVSLKHLCNFWRSLKRSLINWEINLIPAWSTNCVITNWTGAETCAITDTKLYALVVTLSTQDRKCKTITRVEDRF